MKFCEVRWPRTRRLATGLRGVEHTAAGPRRLVERLGRAGVVEVGTERPDGPVVDALLARSEVGWP